MKISLAISIYLLVAGYLYYRDRHINKNIIKYLKSACPVPPSAMNAVLLGYALLLPVITAERLLVRALGIKKAPSENEAELNQILEEIYPEEIHDLDDVSIELEGQDVEPFIRQIPPVFDSGLTEIWIRRIMDDVRTLAVGDDNRHIFYPMWQGKRVTLVTEIKREKKDLFVLLFWALPDVAKSLDTKMDEFCEPN